MRVRFGNHIPFGFIEKYKFWGMLLSNIFFTAGRKNGSIPIRKEDFISRRQKVFKRLDRKMVHQNFSLFDKIYNGATRKMMCSLKVGKEIHI
jgi:hypothetical protein